MLLLSKEQDLNKTYLSSIRDTHVQRARTCLCVYFNLQNLYPTPHNNEIKLVTGEENSVETQ